MRSKRMAQTACGRRMIMIPAWQMEAYENLRTEVVRSAVKDLRKAIRKSNRLGRVCHEQTALEAWFLSSWGQLLCENQGKYIAERCRETYNVCKHKKPKKRFSDEEEQMICREYQGGTRYNHILQKYKISSATLYNILRRWG